MRSWFKKIAAFLLAFLMMLATSSFTISMHYCGKKLVRTSINKPPKSCCKFKKEFTKSTCKKKSCCSDKEFVKKSQQSLTSKNTPSTYLKTPYVKESFHYFSESSIPAYVYKPKYLSYIPPPLILENQILFQVFLI